MPGPVGLSSDKTVEASDTYFGKTYHDPYRWLENLKDKEVEAWFKAQGELTDGRPARIPGGTPGPRMGRAGPIEARGLFVHLL